jgi:hypothetical protein
MAHMADTSKERARVFHNLYTYCGSHWEKAGETIYHYISKARLGTRSIHDLAEWDYDTEVWIYDDIWIYCGPESSMMA